MSVQPNINRNTTVRTSISVAQVANRNLISNRSYFRQPTFPRDGPVHVYPTVPALQFVGGLI